MPRPKKRINPVYTEADIARMRLLKQRGLSLRGIARAMGMFQYNAHKAVQRQLAKKECGMKQKTYRAAKCDVWDFSGENVETKL